LSKKALVSVVDYGVGNIRSVTNALEFLGYSVLLARHPSEIQDAQMLVLPGVGDFGAVSRAVKSSGLWGNIQEYLDADRPFLGICVGMQLLFETSEEAPDAMGFGVLEGGLMHLNSLNSEDVTPSVGWQKLSYESRKTDSFSDLSEAYFVHSYFAKGVNQGDVLSTYSWNDRPIPAHLAKGRIHGVQFHPEKSRKPGLDFIERIIETATEQT
jgi:imidazole glycerol phosphate synthase glutamine amidotransferase subunit